MNKLSKIKAALELALKLIDTTTDTECSQLEKATELCTRGVEKRVSLEELKKEFDKEFKPLVNTVTGSDMKGLYWQWFETKLRAEIEKLKTQHYHLDQVREDNFFKHLSKRVDEAFQEGLRKRDQEATVEQPVQSKECSTCEHRDRQHYEDPCCSCDKDAVYYKRAKAIKNCQTCEYEYRNGISGLCSNCDANYSNHVEKKT